MAWLYILQCADGSYYVGSTPALERRLAAAPGPGPSLQVEEEVPDAD